MQKNINSNRENWQRDGISIFIASTYPYHCNLKAIKKQEYPRISGAEKLKRKRERKKKETEKLATGTKDSQEGK